MSLVCGFNVFSQLDDGADHNSVIEGLIALEGIKILDFSWSSVLFRQGCCIKYRGFVENRRGQTLIINPPNDEYIVKGRCIGGSVLVVTREGSCWKYCLQRFTWSRLFLRESNSDDEEKGHGIIDLAASDNITLLLNHIGEVFSFPSLVSGAGLKGKQVACGLEHSVFLSDTGSVYTWGSSSRGQLGHGDIESRDEPVEVVALSGLGVKTVAAGGWHTCAVTSSGDLYAWGWNRHNQIGVSSNDGEVVSEPRLVELPSPDMVVKSVSCGSSHTVILLEDSKVYGFGLNRWGQLGGKDEKMVSLKLMYEPVDGVSVESVHAASWNTAIILMP